MDTWEKSLWGQQWSCPQKWCSQAHNDLMTLAAAAAAKSLQSCPILCYPIDSSPPGSPVPGILQARILEWAAVSFSDAWKWKVKVKSLSRVQLLATPRTAAYQAPPSIGFSRQEYWSGVPLPSPMTLDLTVKKCIKNIQPPPVPFERPIKTGRWPYTQVAEVPWVSGMLEHH